MKKKTKLNNCSGVEVHGREYSFGFVEQGSGVYPCSPEEKPDVQVPRDCRVGHDGSDACGRGPRPVAEMTLRWSGASYSLLTRNCVHFCEEICEGLGCTVSVPPWVNAAAAGPTAPRAPRGAAAAAGSLRKERREWLEGVVSAARAGPSRRRPRRTGYNIGRGTGAAKR